jgi:uncharacterized protein YecT (DUF1311 family)
MQSLKYLSTLVVTALLFLNVHSAEANHSDDPCQGKGSNREMRECYATEQARINGKADALVEKIAADLLKDAKDPLHGASESDALRRAAATLGSSQQSWRMYRDQHCKAVEYGWTNGSGAGTAYDACMFALGEDRVHQLRSDFNFAQR